MTRLPPGPCYMCGICLQWLPEAQFEYRLEQGLLSLYHITKSSTHPTQKELPNMATKNTASINSVDELLAAINGLIASYLDGADEAQTQTTAPKTRKSSASTKKAAPEPEPEDDEDGDDDGKKYAEADLKKKSLAALKKIAIGDGFDKDELADADKEEIIEALLEIEADEDSDDADDDDDDADAEDGEDDDDDSDEDNSDEDDDDDDEELREELMAMTLAKLKKTARDDYEATGEELKGLDKEGIVDLILNADAEDDADVDVDEDQDDEDGYTEDELKDMSIGDLKEILDEWEVEYSAKARTATLIKLILETQDEDDYEDDDDDA